MRFTIAALSLLLGIIVYSNHGNCASHWIMSDDGTIAPEPDSVFNLRKPGDLLTFIEQDKRMETVNKLEAELKGKQKHIVDTEGGQTKKAEPDLEQRILEEDENCKISESTLEDSDLYSYFNVPMERLAIELKQLIDFDSAPVDSPDLLTPVCQNIIPLTFSMNALPHIYTMDVMASLKDFPESELTLSREELPVSVRVAGHLLHVALKGDPNSWRLYNYAALYWRIVGHSVNAVECVRRSLHYIPSIVADVPLMHFAGVLHRSGLHRLAASVLELALALGRNPDIVSLAMGNVFAATGDYNASAHWFNSVPIESIWRSTAETRRVKALCTLAVSAGLHQYHALLENTLSELRDFQKQHNLLQETQQLVYFHQQLPGVRVLEEEMHDILVGRRFLPERAQLPLTELTQECKSGEGMMAPGGPATSTDADKPVRSPRVTTFCDILTVAVDPQPTDIDRRHGAFAQPLPPHSEPQDDEDVCDKLPPVMRP